MTKLTKKTYNKSLGLLNNELDAVKAILSLAEETNGISLPDLDMWNEYHDRQDAIENAIADLKASWDRRNWTWQNHSLANLVAQNID